MRRQIHHSQIDQSSKEVDNTKPEIRGDDDEKYEEQYHPRVTVVDIFGKGDVIEKVNGADEVNIVNGEESEESEEQQSSNVERGAP